MFIPSVSIQLTRLNADEEDASKEIGGSKKALGQKKYAGQFIQALSVKNRFCKRDIISNMYLDPNTGLHRLAGIAELAVTLEVVVPENDKSTKYIIKKTGEEIGTVSKWCKNEVILEKILPYMNEVIKREWSFGSEGEDGIVLDGSDLDDEDGAEE